VAAGFLHQGVCYSTMSDATAAHWSQNPAFITAGSTSYIADVVWSGTAWVVKKYTLSSAGALTLNSTTNAPALTFPTCDTFDTFKDGMTLGWGVALAMICAWAITNLKKSL